jgi:hypothetical protein
MHNIFIFDQKIRTVEVSNTRYVVLEDIFLAGDITWKDFCPPRTIWNYFVNNDFQVLVDDLGLTRIDNLWYLPVAKVELFILRAATGVRPLTPLSRVSEIVRSVADYWEKFDETKGKDQRNVYVMAVMDDLAYRMVIPEFF